MSDVKWIKIVTNIFEDEKIVYIQSLPNADSILVIWFILLTLAGKCNDKGLIYLTKNMPYTAEMLSYQYRKPLEVVKQAIDVFVELNMIEIENGFLRITNWEKHQNVEGLEKIRKKNRERVARYRAKKKQEECNVTCNVTSNVTETLPVTLRNAIDIDIDKDIDIDNNMSNINITMSHSCDEVLTKEVKERIINAWNSLTEFGITPIKTLNEGTNRYKYLKARLKQYSLDDILQAIENIKQSPFLQGYNKNSWTIDFDWFIRPNNFPKVLEGKYLPKENKLSSNDDNWRGDDERL